MAGLTFSIRGKVNASVLIKSSQPSLRRVTLHPTSIPLRIFHAWILREDRLATHLRCVRSSIARKKASERFLLKPIGRKRKDTTMLDIIGKVCTFTLGKSVSIWSVWLYFLCSVNGEISYGRIVENFCCSIKR